MRPAVTRTACVLATVALGACGAGDVPIRIGLAGPFSQERGQSMRLAAELAVQEINRQGGVRGRELALVVRDDSADATTAVRVARALYDTPGLVAVIGHLNSGATIAAAPIYNRGERPVAAISPSASSPELSGAGPYTFRVCPDDLVHGRRLAEWARNQLGAQRAAVIYENDEYGRGVRRTFVDNFTELGGVLVAEDPYVNAIPSFEPYLRRLARRGGAEVLMIAGTRAGAARILATLDTVGLRPAVVAGDGVAGLERAGGRRAEGMYISSAYLPDQPDTRNRTFIGAYRQAHGDQLPDHRGAGAYDIVYLLARTIDEVGTDRARIRDYLAGVGTESPAFEGVTGTIAFDGSGDVPEKRVVIGIVNGTRLETAPGQ